MDDWLSVKTGMDQCPTAKREQWSAGGTEALMYREIRPLLVSFT